MVRDAPLRGAPHHEVGVIRAPTVQRAKRVEPWQATTSDLILRSGPQDRVSKDGPRWGPWFETPRYARLLTMRSELLERTFRPRSRSERGPESIATTVRGTA
jgi:hypothetical protein